MVGKEELHDAASSDSCLLRLSDDLEVWSDLSSTGGDGLWRALDLDKAHSAVSSHRESLVVAETRDFDSCFDTSLVDGVRAVHLDWLVVNVDIEQLVSGLTRSKDCNGQRGNYLHLLLVNPRLESCFALLAKASWRSIFYDLINYRPAIIIIF